MPEENEFPFDYVERRAGTPPPPEPPKLTDLLHMVREKRQQAYDKHVKRVDELRKDNKLHGTDYDACGYWDAYLGLSVMLNEIEALVRAKVHVGENGKVLL